MTAAARSRASAWVRFEEAPLVRKHLLCSHEPLLHRARLGEERERDLVRPEAAHEPQNQRRLRVLGKRGMAAREHHPENVRVDVLVGRRIGREVVGVESVVDPAPHAPPPRHVSGAVLGDVEEPGSRVRGQSAAPRLERNDERLLRDVFGESEVAHAEEAGEGRDEPPRLLPKQHGQGVLVARRHRPGCISWTGRTSTLPSYS
jgi:hypothetical protein